MLNKIKNKDNSGMTHRGKIMTKYLLPMIFVFGVLSGCGTKDVDVEKDGPPTEDIQPIVDDSAQTNGLKSDSQKNGSIIADDGTEANANALQDDILSPQQMLEEEGSPLTTRLIYFEYNSAKIDDASLALLESHGDFISDNGDVQVRLEGHSDERGSREFNVALGDRRNQSVRRLLLFQGASTDQIKTVSYGEELPAIIGHNEEAWSKNRRVELIYEIK